MLILIVFGVTQVAATPYSLCRHVSAEAHATALVSADRQTAVEAHAEEALAAATQKLASLTDKVAASAATGILPNQTELSTTFAKTALEWPSEHLDISASRALAPLLQPPSA